MAKKTKRKAKKKQTFNFDKSSFSKMTDSINQGITTVSGLSGKITKRITEGSAKTIRKNEREYFKKTQKNQNQARKDGKKKVTYGKTDATTTLFYTAPSIAAGILGPIAAILLTQWFMSVMLSLSLTGEPVKKVGMFSSTFGLGWLYFLYCICGIPLYYYVHHKLKAIWTVNNAAFLDDQNIQEYANDAYIRTMDHITQQLEVAPDIALGFDGHVSTIMSHAMISNKGIKKIKIPVLDPDVPGQVKRDENGDIVYRKVEMFDTALGNKLFKMSGVPHESREFFDATQYDYNPKISRRDGGDGKERSGAYGRKEYDTLADYINNEFYPLDTETDRPAGVYFYDNRPVNTILIAITRGGKGQTYIEIAFDLWTREAKKWNIFTTDPKGELLAKFYYAATVRGMDVIQFNLMHPNLTNVFNPLANAIQEFRRNNPGKGESIIDSIISTLFPDNGEIWNPAAGNMFRRAVYMLFDYYIEQEKYIRYVGYRDNIPQEIIDQDIDDNYSKITLFNVYSLIGDLASKISKDPEFINVDPSAPPVGEKDLLTLMFDAMAMLPSNVLRQKAITANNSIKQVAQAQQTIACIYATLLTGLSVYADDTAKALMSGSLSESFDITGLGFPRRFGINFDPAYVEKFNIAKELCIWTIYRDKNFTDQYTGDDYLHEETFSPSNWTWGHFKGIFDQEETYIKLTIDSNGTIAKEFYFKFTKGYKTSENITYIIDPITRKKIISDGVLIELDPITKEPTVSTFNTPQFDYYTKTYRMTEKPIIKANQVYYSERPKFIFAITPPHLQVYQKHILIIIKQILDEQYSNSYVVKSNRKPIVGTRLMLEEFGNIRSGENGIPDIDTVTSIALGQDIQLTFVLQSFQQLRAVYGEDVEKIIRANSSNTIFLKSNDEELVNELVRLSGTKHEMRVAGKSFTQKPGDIATVGEPVINYNSNHVETTALTANDLLFLAGNSPGNSITFSSGEMPIVNKLANITPMAAGLHRQLPQAVYNKEEKQTVQYSDSTMPSTNTNSNNNFNDNLIDGETLVRARVDQAKIAVEITKTILEIAEKHSVKISENNGELSDIVMNVVYEEYEKNKGITRENSTAEPIKYADLADEMSKQIFKIQDKTLTQEERANAAIKLKENLLKCVMDKNLSDLTKIYSDTASDIIIGFNPEKVTEFVVAFSQKYPKTPSLIVETQDVFEIASKEPTYTPYDDGNVKEGYFDTLSPAYEEALTDVLCDILDGEITYNMGVEFRDLESKHESQKRLEVSINDVKIGILEITKLSEDTNNNGYDYTFLYINPDGSSTKITSEHRRKISEVISKNKHLLGMINSYLQEM